MTTSALPPPGSAAIINVPSQQPTVRTAVDAASSGDTVLIAPGIHPGGVYIKGKVVTLASWFLLTGDTAFVSQTVIDSVIGQPCILGGCAGDVVLEFAKDTHGSAVIGLTVQHGFDGIRSRATVDVAFCHILRNADGIDYQSGSGGVIRNNLVANNTDDGIDLNGRTTVRVLNNTIRDNHQDGVEFRLYPYSGPTLNIDFIGNRFTGNGGDGIQLIDYPDTSNRIVRIEHNLFSTNGDAAVGCMPDGITSEDFSGAPLAERVFLINNTFLDGHYGFVGGANVIALNNVFAGTVASALRRMGGNSIASYCLFWNNGTDYEDSNLDLPHILHADPALNADGSLTTGSPAIDSGTAAFQWQGQTVLDLPATAYAGSAPDMGVFEVGRALPDGNTAPLVDAGPDQTITLAAGAVLDGMASDDWLPSPPTLTVTWSKESGPGPVTFGNPNAIDTYATFTVEGTYVLLLAANDGALGSADSVRVTVQPGPPPGVVSVDRRIAGASDDQEETATGGISPNISDLEMVLGPTVQKVGLRFTNVTVPQGATVARAYLQFEADEAQGEATSLLIQGQAADDPGTFTTDPFNVSSRPRTTASVGWSPAPWNLVGEQGADQRTPELAAVLQELVNRPGWVSGNAMAFIITGAGHRTACSYEGLAAGAALLHIEASSQITGVSEGLSPGLFLHRVTPNPSRGPLRVDFSLADGGPAALELVDLTGRRVAAHDLGLLGEGSHSVNLRDALPRGCVLRAAVAGQPGAGDEGRGVEIAAAAWASPHGGDRRPGRTTVPRAPPPRSSPPQPSSPRDSPPAPRPP